ncbi:MAG: Flagellar hook protein FlgE [Planctomycetota bacterium]|jgi:flagellar hook protein FlgE
MGLASSLSTALTGMNAAETQIDVLGNNLANSQTVGFKSSEIIFATQFLQTLSLGAAPSADNGGANPRQTGLGVQVAGISPKFTQGTIEISSTPSDMAVQGDGFFMVEAAGKERLFTRTGIFKLNSENQLVTPTGNRLLGFGVDQNYNIQTTQLEPLKISLGTEAVAQATTEVTMEGTLTPRGDVADTAAVVQSTVLGDGSLPRPDSTGLVVATSAVPDVTGVTVVNAEGGGTHPENATYRYKVVFVDATGTESMASPQITVTTPTGNGAADNRITLNNLPTSTQYTEMRIYRTEAGGSDFFFLAQKATGGSYVDNNSTPLSSTPLNTAALNGNYSYMITYYKAGKPETRPSPLAGPQNVVNGRIQLSNFPTPPVPGPGIPEYDSIRIYRNLSNNQDSYFLVDTIGLGQTYTDSKSDSTISNLATSGNKRINLDGPTVDSNSLLVDIVRRDGFQYQNIFKEGTLEYKAKKGGRALETRSFTVTANSTVQDLMRFMQDSMGIQTPDTDPTNPIATSLNKIAGESGTLAAGGYLQDGRIRFVSNNGVDNALDIDLSAFKMTDTLGNITTPNLGFGKLQEATGQSTVADFIAYDSLGLPIRMRVTAVLENRTDVETIYRWYADSADNAPAIGSKISVGTGLIRFDGTGNFVAATNAIVAVDRSDFPSISPLEFTLDFDQMNGLAVEKPSMVASRQNGSPPGVLSSYIISEDGLIRGVFSNGVSRDLGKIRLARFTNPEGLEQRGQNLYAQGINTGLPIEGSPGENGIGSVVSGALELSNTDIGADLVSLVLASTQYRSNSRVITATQQLFDELLNLRR